MIEKVASFSHFRKVGQKYYVTDGIQGTFYDAIQVCKDVGGTVVLPKTAAENQALMKLVLSSGSSGKKTYIGVTDRQTEGQFVDIEGKLLTFTNWGTGQPDDYKGGQDCGCIEDSGVWDDVGCTGGRPIICEIDDK